MDEKGLIKLGISVLAIVLLGAVAVYKYPELTHVPTRLCRGNSLVKMRKFQMQQKPAASELFKNQMDEFESNQWIQSR